MSYDISKLMLRFRSKVTINEDGCWIWTAANNGKGGYGVFRLKDKMVLSHRFAYEHLVGPIPPGYDIDHFRMNPGPKMLPCSKACCNPEHLEAVTTSVNIKRGRTGHHNNKGIHNSSKTHCKYGHPFDEENTMYRTDHPKRRQCRTCNRDLCRKWREDKKALLASQTTKT